MWCQAHLEICRYFNVKIRVTNVSKFEIYRGTEAYDCVSNVPDEVPHPIEPIRYVLGRDTTP